MGAEYIAASEVVKDVKWIVQLLKDIGAHVELPVEVCCDNQAAIALVKSSSSFKRAKHIDVRYHFIREESANGLIELKYLSTENQPADTPMYLIHRCIFTKPLSSPSFNHCKKMLNIRDETQIEREC